MVFISKNEAEQEADIGTEDLFITAETGKDTKTENEIEDEDDDPPSMLEIASWATQLLIGKS